VPWEIGLVGKVLPHNHGGDRFFDCLKGWLGLYFLFLSLLIFLPAQGKGGSRSHLLFDSPFILVFLGSFRLT
jgi:hypothetical protein